MPQKSRKGYQWRMVEDEGFRVLLKDGEWTGYSIEKLNPYFCDIPKFPPVFHVRNGLTQEGIADTPTLREAKAIVNQLL